MELCYRAGGYISSTTGSPTLNWSGQIFAVGDVLKLTTTVPGGFGTNTFYYVVATSGGTDFQLATTAAGTPINATTTISNGTGVRFASWPVATNWTSSIVPSGVDATATIGTTLVNNIAGINLDGAVTIGTLSTAASGTGEVLLTNGHNNGALNFATGGTTNPAIIATGTSGVRKLHLGEITNGITLPLKITGTQGLDITTPVYTASGGYYSIWAQPGLDWSGFSGTLRLLQGVYEIRNTASGATAGNNKILPNTRLVVGTGLTSALLLFNVSITGNYNTTQTVGALDGSSAGYIASSASSANGTATLIIGTDNRDGTYAGTIGQGPNVTTGNTTNGRINIQKEGTGTETFTGSFMDGITGTIHSALTVNNGKLILSGINLYQGATTINGGTLAVNGSITSAVTVNAGTLQGNGTSSAAITVGTGSGAGATLAPGNSIGTITTTGAISLKSDATYSVEINSAASTTDQIVANGVTLTNPTLTLTDLGTTTNLPIATVYTIINNTSATPISGTFKTLAEGSTVVIGVNTFKVSYIGGDGNDVTLTVISAILPLNLISFAGQLSQNNTILLSFTTNTEVNFGNFIIEKSSNGIDFNPIDNVAAKNILTINNYAFTDVSPFAANNYYRLKMVDKDGTFSYSKIVLINVDALQQISLMLFPNPVVNNLIISHTKAMNGAVIKIYNTAGKLLLSNTIPNGAVTTNIDVAMFISGHYTLTYTNGGKTVTAAFVK